MRADPDDFTRPEKTKKKIIVETKQKHHWQSIRTIPSQAAPGGTSKRDLDLHIISGLDVGNDHFFVSFEIKYAEYFWTFVT